jgi:hypothetical protein
MGDAAFRGVSLKRPAERRGVRGPARLAVLAGLAIGCGRIGYDVVAPGDDARAPAADRGPAAAGGSDSTPGPTGPGPARNDGGAPAASNEAGGAASGEDGRPGGAIDAGAPVDVPPRLDAAAPGFDAVPPRFDAAAPAAADARPDTAASQDSPLAPVDGANDLPTDAPPDAPPAPSPDVGAPPPADAPADAAPDSPVPAFDAPSDSPIDAAPDTGPDQSDSPVDGAADADPDQAPDQTTPDQTGGTGPSCESNLVWEADFSRDPTTVNDNGDGVRDWNVRGGGAFPVAELMGGVWTNASEVLDTNPTNTFVSRTLLHVRVQSTVVPSSGNGAYVWINVDNVSVGRFAAIYVTVIKEAAGGQKVELFHKPTNVAVSLGSWSGLPDQMLDIKLDVDVSSRQVSIWIEGVLRGRYAYSPQANNVPIGDKWASLWPSSPGSSFDHFKVTLCGP